MLLVPSSPHVVRKSKVAIYHELKSPKKGLQIIAVCWWTPPFIQKIQNRRNISLWFSRAVIEEYQLDLVKEQESTEFVLLETNCAFNSLFPFIS